MKKEGHLEKAKWIEMDFQRVKSEEAKTECLYGAVLHYIAYFTDEKIGEHKDMHKNLHKFLIEKGFSKLASLWEEAESIREGGWYGRRGFPKRGYEILEEVKQEIGVK